MRLSWHGHRRQASDSHEWSRWDRALGERSRTTTSGGGGIRTHERVTPLHAFEFCEPTFRHGRRRPPRAQHARRGCHRTPADDNE